MSKYPFKCYAWDDSPANDNRWCDGAEAEAAYDSLRTELEAVKEANNNCISRLLHESRMKAVEDERDKLQSELEAVKQALKHDVDKIEAGYIAERDRLQAENKTLTDKGVNLCLQYGNSLMQIDRLTKANECLKAGLQYAINKTSGDVKTAIYDELMAAELIISGAREEAK